MKTVIKVRLVQPTPADKEEKRALRLFDTTVSILIESLRYAGVIKVEENEPQTARIFYIYPPVGIVKAAHQHWAESNVARMKTFGINASVEQIII